MLDYITRSLMFTQFFIVIINVYTVIKYFCYNLMWRERSKARAYHSHWSKGFCLFFQHNSLVLSNAIISQNYASIMCQGLIIAKIDVGSEDLKYIVSLEFLTLTFAVMQSCLLFGLYNHALCWPSSSVLLH